LSAALDHLNRSIPRLDDPREKARALLDVGAVHLSRGDLAAARSAFFDALRASPPGGREEAAVRNNLAIILSREGHPAAAAEAFATSADLADRAGDARLASMALGNAVENLLSLPDVAGAQATAERALGLATSIGDPIAVSIARANLGLVLIRRGEWSLAEEQLLGSVRLVEGLGNPYSLAERYADVARLYEAQGRAADAAPWRARAQDLRDRLRDGAGAPAPP
jgi:tetratricopeptide (TPR) repeat protein